jgi:hypothetical protein
MATETSTLNIPKDVIEPIIQQHVNDAVLRALGGHEEILRATVARIVTLKVDREGKPTSYNGQSWIDWAVGKTIRDATKAALESSLQKHQRQIEAVLIDELSKKRSPFVRSLVRSMTTGVVEAVANKWRLSIEIKEPTD